MILAFTGTQVGMTEQQYLAKEAQSSSDYHSTRRESLSLMNVDLIRKDIEEHHSELPEIFIPGTMYSEATQAYCIWGWLAKVAGGPDPKLPISDENEPIGYLERRYGLHRYPVWTGRADRIIDELSTEMRDLWLVAPAKQVIERFLSELESISAEDFAYRIIA